MSIGKKSIARAANAAVKAETKTEVSLEVATADEKAAPAEEVAVSAEKVQCAAEKVTVKKKSEKFKKVSIGDRMPAFLL